MSAVISFLFLLGLSSAITVSYDSRSLIIDGQRKLLFGGCIHYPRSTPQMWPDLLQKAKAGGIDLIETYIFWNAHEPVKGQYTFSGNLDLIAYLKQCQLAGLYVHIRIGPYVCAEWNYGGFPEWLKEIPGIVFRTNNTQYLNEMKTWVDYVVSYLKSNNMFASQGGPIILAQIENEYGNVESAYGEGGKQYVQWCGNYAQSLNVGVPWIMCAQSDAPAGIINTVNGFYGDNFEPNSPNTPKIWTENWPGWFQDWYEAVPRRPVEDVSFAVSRFFAKGGSMAVYYMYHGGTNFGRTAGGPFITTTYDYDTAIDEYGLTHEPKYSHLKHLHDYIHQFSNIMLAYPEPPAQSLGYNLEAHVYGLTTNSSFCVAFLSNIGTSDATVTFNGQSYSLPAWSVSILSSCKTVVYNSALVQAPTIITNMNDEKTYLQIPKTKKANVNVDIPATSWSWWNENRDGLSWGSAVYDLKPYEQLNVTHDSTDYLWYQTNYTSTTAGAFTLKISAFYDYINIFVNGVFIGAKTSSSGSWTINLIKGVNQISLSIQTIGLINYGTFFEQYTRGLLGTVSIGNTDITNNGWFHVVGLNGDSKQIWSTQGQSKVSWTNFTTTPNNGQWVWYKSVFDLTSQTLSSTLPLALDMITMSKGYIWLNGYNLGRHFAAAIAGGSCDSCDYRGSYGSDKCREGCGSPSQRWYHVPREYIQPTNNLLVIFEEGLGDPTGIQLIQRQPGVVCGDVGEDYPADDLTVNLMCADGAFISSINFASFGNPGGACRQFTLGSCHATNSTNIVQSYCLNKNSCAIPVNLQLFGDPCPNVTKRLKVQVTCSN